MLGAFPQKAPARTFKAILGLNQEGITACRNESKTNPMSSTLSAHPSKPILRLSGDNLLLNQPLNLGGRALEAAFLIALCELSPLLAKHRNSNGVRVDWLLDKMRYDARTGIQPQLKTLVETGAWNRPGTSPPVIERIKGKLDIDCDTGLVLLGLPYSWLDDAEIKSAINALDQKFIRKQFAEEQEDAATKCAERCERHGSCPDDAIARTCLAKRRNLGMAPCPVQKAPEDALLTRYFSVMRAYWDTLPVRFPVRPDGAKVTATAEPDVRRLVTQAARRLTDPPLILPGSEIGPLLTRLKDAGKKWALILSDAGQGKSTYLRKLALTLLDDGKTPVLIPCARWEKVSDSWDVATWLQSTAAYPQGAFPKSGDREMLAELLLVKLNDGSGVLLIDAADEARGSDLFATIDRLSADWPILMSCRSVVGAQGFGAETPSVQSRWFRCVLEPLKREDITAYVVRAYPEDDDVRKRFFDALDTDPRTLPLMQNGLSLAMTLWLMQTDPERFKPPVSRDDLYDALADNLLANQRAPDEPRPTGAQSPFEKNWRSRVLERVAFDALFRDIPITDAAIRTVIIQEREGEALPEGIGENQETMPEAMRRDLTENVGLLKETIEGWTFLHETLREYFAARYLSRHWNRTLAGEFSPLAEFFPSLDVDGEAFLQATNRLAPQGINTRFCNLIFDPKRRETMLLMVGRMGKDLETRWMRQLRQVKPLADFALQCLARCNTVQSTSHIIYPILKSLVSQIGWKGRQPCFSALKNSRKREHKNIVTDWLIKRMKDFDSYWSKRQSSIEALVAINAEEAMPEITSLLKAKTKRNDFNYVLDAAIKTITAIDSRSFTKENEPDVEFDADGQLSMILKKLTHPDSGIRQAAIEALVVLDAKEHIQAIARRLVAPDARWEERQTAIAALASLNAKDQIPTIAQRLKEETGKTDPLGYIRRAAIEALVVLDAKEQIHVIVQRLTEPNTNRIERRAAIKALASLNAKDQIPTILQKLTDPDSGVRRAVIEALVALDAKEQIQVIVQKLTDQDYEVRKAVIQALVAFKAVKQFWSEIALRLLEDRYSDVWWAAADALGTMEMWPWYIVIQAQSATDRTDMLFGLATFDHEQKLNEPN